MMVKVFGLVSLLAALAIAALLWSQQGSQAAKGAPPMALRAATTTLEFNHRITGTYAGTSFEDVKVVRADPRSYCVEASGYFVAGPGGAPSPGACTS